MNKRFLIACLLLLSVYSQAQHTARKGFNDGWKFRLDSVGAYSDPAVNDAGWRTLNLPHDWSIEGSFSKDHPAGTGGGALPGGMGWYRKTFSLPAAAKGKQVFIEFDGVYTNSEVFINGHSLGVYPNGYMSFRYELTPHLKYGGAQNVIAVKVDNSRQPNSRWYSGSGIYRNVWLTTLHPTHIDHWGTFVTTPVVNTGSATVAIETNIVAGGATDPQLVTTLYDATGKQVATSTLAAKGAVKQTLKITTPQLWSVERPYLYKAISQLKKGNEVLDTYETKFGVRSFNFDIQKGFSLNGKPLKIMGVCNHHDLGALGAALNTRALERQLEILKAMGCNGIRTSHNPPAPELLELADKMGFIVMDEAFDMWAKAKSPFDYHLAWEQWHKKDLEALVRRDRNHPSVFVWSVGNEIPEQWGDAAKGDSTGRVISRELAAIVRSLDTTRPITTANNETVSSNQLLQSGAFDLVGYNYHHQEWGGVQQRWPGKPFIVTESTSALQTRGHYDLLPMDSIRRWPEAWDKPIPGGGNPDHTVSAYDHVSAPWGSTHEESIKELLRYPHVSGMYVWTGFDYLGEPTPYPWPARSSYFGIIDLAGFPKDVYYLYQSVFTNKPVLHLYPHWNWKAGDTVDVVSYYNNADAVELFLNGISLGMRSKAGDTLHVKWRVPYAPGTLKAVSYKDGNVVVTKEVKTAGAPARLVLKADRKVIKADGADLSFVTIDVTDGNGVLAPRANNLVKFTISGAGTIAAVDNGSPVSMESFKGEQHAAMNGKALCIVQSNGRKGPITLTATAEGMQPVVLQLQAQ
ncbi:beta-galactosidase [Cnuella takakiae]|uniref:Beta-galactosidase n=2 Tax=Cnuella takakiae TaxID=1302690 RepID=A0A1M4T3C0_9BACT|nr:beta-galactosidase GalB [Cnuella takakiae]SHE38915.1 beta-galactosidase [Cnuella takakiae]